MDKQHVPRDDRPFRAAAGRLWALVIGPVFLLGVSIMLSEATRTPWTLTAFYVAVGAIVIMVVFTVFGVKAYRSHESHIRFDLGTVFLATIPLAVHMTAIGWLVRSAEAGTGRPDEAWIMVPFGLLWLIISNVILLLFAEAIIWTAARMVNIWARLHKARP